MADFVARQMFTSRLKSSMDSVRNAVSGPGGESRSQSASMCPCMDKAYAFVADLFVSMTPEEKRRSDFDKRFRKTLFDGEMFTLGYAEKAVSGNLMSQMSSFLGASKKSSTNVKSECIGSPVIVSLDDTNGIDIVWRTCENVQNKPKDSGRVSLHTVQVIEIKDDAIRFMDHHGKLLFEIKSADAEELDEWHKGLNEALVVFAPEIEDSASESRGMMHKQQRYLELQARKREREEKKKSLGNVGMTYTAQAMASR
mmetsp:Transcript_14543/g.25538  ORF Transcript_14543/g.25538 Transcript_14543/m.25538 type:complete len:255 (-) Transcript_14543:2247-3011(-)